MKPLFTLPLLAIIFVSGCTIPGTDIEIPDIFGTQVISLEDDIIIIKDIDTIPSTITAPQQVRLVASIENRGDRDFPLQANPLLGFGGPLFPVPIFGQQIPETITVELFDFCQGLFAEADITTKCPGQQDVQGQTSCTITELLSSEIKEVSWVLKPNEETKLITPCDLKVSVSYPYVTSGLTTVHFINTKEYDRQIAQGTFRPLTSTVSQGQGPVKAWFDIKDSQPIVATTTGEGEVPVTLKIENEGSGFVKVIDQGADRPQVVLLENGITNDIFKTAKQQTCPFSVNNPIDLVQDKRELPCFIKQLPNCDSGSAGVTTSCVAKESTHQLVTTISYFYEFRSEARVTVEPKFQA